MKRLKKQRGVTLIALIVIIIVLLLLAGIAISMLTGQNGILVKANYAKEQTEIETEKEQVQLAYWDAKVQNLGEGITEEQLQDGLNKLVGESKTLVGDNGENYEVCFLKSKRYYEVDQDGNVGDYKLVVEDNYPGDITKDRNGNSIDGSRNQPYQINCIEDLVAFSNMTNGSGYKLENGELVAITSKVDFTGKYVVLNQTLNFKSNYSYKDCKRTDFGDINGDNSDGNVLKAELLTKTGFKPITDFNGYFDGRGNEIQNIYINTAGDAGLFVGSLKEIRNIGVTGSINSIQSNAVGICIFSNLIENCWNKANITAGGNAAGISSSSLTIKSCYNLGKVMTTGQLCTAGGITSGVGDTIVTIEDCYNKGEITGTYYVGGIAAGHSNMATTITNCYNEGNIFGEFSVGGILGINSKSVKNCYNIGNIKSSSKRYAGGIVGSFSGEIDYCHNKGNVYGGYAAGISGLMGSKIINSYNVGEVKGDCVGGIAALGQNNENYEVSNCFNAGKLVQDGTAFQNVGGICGILGNNTKNANFNNCYNIAVFNQGHSTNHIGGIVGNNESGTIIMNKCYYLKSNDITTAISGKIDDINQVTACNVISEITATILNDNIINIEHTDEWKKWKMGEDAYPVFE